MYYFEVAPTKIIRAGSDTFTYSFDKQLPIGQIVTIEVGKSPVTGIVIKETMEPSYRTKPVSSILEPTPLPKQLIETALWVSEYYVTPLATVLQTFLPRGLSKKRRESKTVPFKTVRDRTTIVFNDEQLSVVDDIIKADPGTFLLQGITGSGKTEVYKAIAQKMIEQGKSVIVLTPEIGLTPQVIGEFTHDFKDIIVTHSHMSEAARHKVWLEALHSELPRIVIGPRSALFTPLANIGAIIVDEAHEPSYKQEQSPRYSALRVATMLGRFHGAKVVFGSATPLIADRYVAEQAGRPVLRLTKSARNDVVAPIVTLVDMKNRDSFTHHRFLSNELIQSIEKNILSSKQSLIFHNRRGSASSTLCENCGWTAECPNCFVPLTLHSDHYHLRCHICNHQEAVPSSCPTCHHTDIIHKGIGTKLIESELRRLFPKATIARFDSDNKEAETVTNIYEKLYDGTIDIAIGTQIVAKGLDLPHLRTVGVIQADSGLSLPDFSSDERTFQLLSQVVGRVGRNEHQTEVVVQTYQPTHPSIIFGLHQDYESFYEYALEERKHALFPPFTYLLKLTCVYKTEAGAVNAAKSLAKVLRQGVKPGVQILGPTPAFYERQHDTYRWQLVVKSKKREYLVDALRFVPPAHWQFELDPTSLL
jgi:primosomal protein N' (replication factor Y)